MSDDIQEDEFSVMSVRLDERYGVSTPARWTIEVTAWHRHPPKPGGFLRQIVDKREKSDD